MERDRRKLLVHTGMDLFARYGYRDVSISDISRASGLSVGSFYNYFASKEEFYGKVLDLIEGEGIKKADSVVSRLRSPMNKLKAVYRFVVLGLKQNKILRGVLIREERFLYPGLDARQKDGKGLRSHIEKLLASIMREGMQKGAFRSSLYQDPTAVVISIFDTLLYRTEDVQFERLVDDLLVFLQRGLRRPLRLRRRDERLDRRRLSKHFQDEWL